MTELVPLHDPSNGQMKIIGFMSGGGTNLVKLIEKERNFRKNRKRSPFKVVSIFTDEHPTKANGKKGSKALEIGKQYGLPVDVITFEDFCHRLGYDIPTKEDRVADKRTKDEYWRIRAAYDTVIIERLSKYDADVAAYGGYMKKVTPPLVSAFLGVNLHPADLSIKNPFDMSRRYNGDHAVRDAIEAGETHIRSSTHIIEEKVDDGKLLMISSSLEVILDEGFDPKNPEHLKKAEDFNQDRLKEVGDWIIFPKTVENISRGFYAQDSESNLYFKEVPIPDGVRLN